MKIQRAQQILAQAMRAITAAYEGLVESAIGEAKGLEVEVRDTLRRLQEIHEGLEGTSEHLLGDWAMPQLEEQLLQLEAIESRLLSVQKLVDLLRLGGEIGDMVEGGIVLMSGAPPPPASFGVSFEDEPEENYSVVKVFYATDRDERQDEDGKLEYGTGRSTGGVLHYGECAISIPKVHKMGGLEGPSIWRLEFRPDPNKHVVLLETVTLEEEAYFERVAERVGKSKSKEAFVFIHGYNVSFENAARRAGQLAFDLEFQGAPIFYSWPSNGKTADYPRDEADVAWSAPHFERFLTMLGQRSGAARIHIIAHSMGNRAACEALKGISRNPVPGLEFQHVILAAPDIDAETFAELSVALKRVSQRVTLYASANDKALKLSKVLHGNPRAGEAGDGLLILPHVDTIDASAISTDFLAHSYFGDRWPLLADIQMLLVEDKPPASRFGLLEVVHTAGTYYRFKPE